MQTSDLTHELGSNFIEYAVEVNTDRAIPDATSGLKPVAKRILWGAYNMGAVYAKPHVKSATVVGEVMGKYHPHGDTSIYYAMARLAQDWVMRYPLIDWHGNKGNIIGDDPSADRYTEARLAKLSEDGMLANIKKKNVEFGLNFSDTLDEPKTLPAIFPNLLCNPNTGIGVAMACNWAPHNLGEVAQAIFDYIDGKEPTLPGPDFPTGGVVINKNDIPNIMKTGHGSVKIRGKYRVEKNKLIFYEIPYGTVIKDLLENIAAACDEKLVEGVSRIYDDSNKNGIKLVIECDKTAEPDVVAQRLFNHTDLQSSFSYNQVALVNKTPIELSLKDCIKIYLEHNIDCLTKEVAFDLKKARDRLHIVEGLLIALTNIDDVIHIIREADDPETELMKKYSLTETQTDAILDMKLSRLRKLEKTKFEDEKSELESKIESYTNLLNSTELQLNTIKERLQNLVNKYGDARRTELAQIAITKEEKEKAEIIPEDCVVVITESNLIKRIPTKSFRTQKRNTTGVKNGDDIIKYTVKTNTLDTLMVFTSYGKMYRISVDNIPEGTNVSRGVSVRTLLAKIEDNEIPMAYSSLKHDTSAKFVFFATKQGLVKKVPLDEYRSTKKSTGIIALTLREGDALAAVTFIEDEEMLLISKQGMSIRFASKDMPISSRTAQGVKGIALKEGDEVLTCLPIHKVTDSLAIIAATGIGKQIPLTEFTTQNRGGRGLICYKEEVAGAALIDETDALLISGDKSSLKINANDLPALNRAAQGNAMLKNNNKVVSVVKV